MPTATVTSKGQVTIPQKIRELLKVKTGDQIDFIVDKKGRVMILGATTSIRDLKGILHRPGRKPVSLKEMEEAIIRHHRSQGKRS